MPVAIFSLAGYCLALAAFTRQDPDDMPPLVVPALVLALYAGALLGVLAWVTYGVLAGGIVLLAWRLGAWIRCAWTRERPAVARSFLTSGIILFVAGSCLMALLAAPSAYWDWDEFSHWGLAIKELAAHHTLWGGTGPVHFSEYPPGTALFQYAMLIPGGFSEGRTHAAQGILLLAFLTPLIKRVAPEPCRNGVLWVRAFVIGAVTFAIVHIFGGGLFTLYVDGLLGVIFGGTVVAYLLAPPFSRLALIRAALGLALLALIKGSGLLFALVGTGVIVADLALGIRPSPAASFVLAPFGPVRTEPDPPEEGKQTRWARFCHGGTTSVSSVDRNQPEQKTLPSPGFRPSARSFTTHRARVIALSCALLACPLLVFAPWYIRCQSMRTTDVMPPPVAPGHEAPVQEALTHAQRGVVVQRFTRALTIRRIGTLDVAAWVRAAARQAGLPPPRIPGWVCLSTVTWSILVAVCLALQRRTPPCPPGFRRLAVAHAVLGLGGGLYLMGLLWAYRYGFRPAEALSLASFGRYVGTYGAAWLMVLMGLPIAAAACKSRSFIAGTCVAAGLAVLAVETTVSPVWPPLLSARRERLRDLAIAVRAHTADNSRLFHVSQGSDGFDHAVMRYELAPRRTEYWGWSLGTHAADAGHTSPVPAEVWATMLDGYDYVLLGRTDTAFAERYGILFADPATLPNHHLFTIRRRSNGSLRLDPLD